MYIVFLSLPCIVLVKEQCPIFCLSEGCERKIGTETEFKKSEQNVNQKVK